VQGEADVGRSCKRHANQLQTSMSQETRTTDQKPLQSNRFRPSRHGFWLLVWLGSTVGGAFSICVIAKGDLFGTAFGALVAGVLGCLCDPVAALVTRFLPRHLLRIALAVVAGAATVAGTVAVSYPVDPCPHCQPLLLSFWPAVVFGGIVGAIGSGLGGLYSYDLCDRDPTEADIDRWRKMTCDTRSDGPENHKAHTTEGE
jgi:hypothetical protein